MFDLKKFVHLKSLQILTTSILSVCVFKDNQNAIISDYNGFIIKLNWKINTNVYDFQTIKDYEKVGYDKTFNICLTEDETNLIVCSDCVVKIWNLEKNVLIKKFLVK